MAPIEKGSVTRSGEPHRQAALRTLNPIDRLREGAVERRPRRREPWVKRRVFEEARHNDWFAYGQSAPGDGLDICRRLTSQLEAKAIKPLEGQPAVLTGFGCWRALVESTP